MLIFYQNIIFTKLPKFVIYIANSRFDWLYIIQLNSIITIFSNYAFYWINCILNVFIIWTESLTKDFSFRSLILL